MTSERHTRPTELDDDDVTARSASPTSAALTRGASVRLFVPEDELPVALRRRFGGGALDQDRSHTLIVDRSEGFSAGATMLGLAYAGMLGLLSGGGFHALLKATTIGTATLPNMLFWGIWGALAGLVGLMALLALIATLAGLSRGFWVEQRVSQGRWPYGLFLMRQALILRTATQCHVVPRARIVGVEVMRGGEDYHLCPGVLWRDDRGEVMRLCLEGRFTQPIGDIHEALDAWRKADVHDTLAAVPDRRRAPGDLAALPSAPRLEADRELTLWTSPLATAPSPYEAWWRRWTGRATRSNQEGALSFDDSALHMTLSDGARVSLRWDEPFRVTLSAWLISPQTAELSASLRATQAPPTSPSIAFRVRVPQQQLSSALPLKESGHPHLLRGDFDELWPVIAFFAAVHGEMSVQSVHVAAPRALTE